MNISEFDFDLPESLISVRPKTPRSSAKLLYSNGQELTDLKVGDLPSLLRPGDRLVLNDTRVIPARLCGKRLRTDHSGRTHQARIEFNLNRSMGEGRWAALAKPLKRLAIADEVKFGSELRGRVETVGHEACIVCFDMPDDEFLERLQFIGGVPLPPYLMSLRSPDDQDVVDYQSVFSRNPGAVAAPTASLHLDNELLTELHEEGIEWTFVTLHVGAGTFLPIRHDEVSRHRMHGEWGQISDSSAADINSTLNENGRVIPVGTTAMRLLETAAHKGRIEPWRGVTEIFIQPGFQFQVCRGLLTNFHQPRSTLAVLVAAFVGIDRMRAIYDHAIRSKYRFLSYGDCSLLFPCR